MKTGILILGILGSGIFGANAADLAENPNSHQVNVEVTDTQIQPFGYPTQH